jgi:hypothetical protein
MPQIVVRKHANGSPSIVLRTGGNAKVRDSDTEMLAEVNAGQVPISGVPKWRQVVDANGDYALATGIDRTVGDRRVIQNLHVTKDIGSFPEVQVIPHDGQVVYPGRVYDFRGSAEARGQRRVIAAMFRWLSPIVDDLEPHVELILEDVDGNTTHTEPMPAISVDRTPVLDENSTHVASFFQAATVDPLPALLRAIDIRVTIAGATPSTGDHEISRVGVSRGRLAI